MNYNTSLAKYFPRPISGFGKYARFGRILFVQLGLMFVSVFEMVEHVLHLLSTVGADVVVIFMHVLDVSAKFVRFKGGIFALVTEVIFLFFMDTSDVCS